MDEYATAADLDVHMGPTSSSHMFLSLLWLHTFDSVQDISILLNLIIILLMLFNTYVFQVGLVAILLERFRALLMLSVLYLTFSITLHCWLTVRTSTTLCFLLVRTAVTWLWLLHCFWFPQNLRWLSTDRFIWTDGLQVLFMLHRTGNNELDSQDSKRSIIIRWSVCRH